MRICTSKHLLYLYSMILEFHHSKSTGNSNVWMFTGKGICSIMNATEQDLEGFQRLAKKHSIEVVQKVFE